MRTGPLRYLLAAVCVAAVGAAAAPAGAAQSQAISSNWAGYAAIGRYKRVTSSWTQPAAHCHAGQAGYSAFWIGLGGASRSSNALEQTGTEADCSASGRARYAAWYELVPSAPVTFGLRISPGDAMSASVSVSGHTVRISLTDATRRRTAARTLRMSAPDVSSAEWIAEAPSECLSSGACTVLPLANFGSVRFTRGTATRASGRALPISAAGSLQAISLAGPGLPSGGRFASAADLNQATPGPLSADGRSFLVIVSQAVAPQPPTVQFRALIR